MDSSFGQLAEFCNKEETIIITDSNVARLYAPLFEGYKAAITIPAGENNKSLNSIISLTSQLIVKQAHRKTTIVGVGGGMVTDLTGFFASIYMRGVRFGFVPTTLLGMVDAAIGGKNGVNVGLQKNLLGTIQQPSFILYDYNFLHTLPNNEWSNGFAEVIKYGCLFDEQMFTSLSKHDLRHYRNDPQSLAKLVDTCIGYKNQIVLDDEQEQGKRKLLNFGHTAGHAFETICRIPHGHGVALGMIVACIVSEYVVGLHSSVKNKLAALLLRYQLPITLEFDPEKVIEVLRMDKKRNEDSIDYVMLNNLGNPVVKAIPFNVIREALNTFCHASRV
ncbi:MAG: 3-dehydroquinate synthase [Sphingobacteriales bacterium]|nr:MAG: 3-dehydroquinate synthase [Sphingobacteriales bacterium]